MTIRVLVCDDHLIVRQGIRQVLADAGDIEVMAEAASGAEVMQQVRGGAARGAGPQVVLMDIAMPQRDGLGGCRALGRAHAGEISGARIGAGEAWGESPQRAGNDAWPLISPRPFGLKPKKG